MLAQAVPVDVHTTSRRARDEIITLVAERYGSRERISERTAEQIVDAHVPQVVKRTIEVPKMAEQILDVPVPEMVEKKLQETVSDTRIQQRNVERIIDGPVP